MGIAEVIALVGSLLQLAQKLQAEGRAATDAEVEALLADVKTRQAAAEAEWAELLPK